MKETDKRLSFIHNFDVNKDAPIDLAYFMQDLGCDDIAIRSYFQLLKIDDGVEDARTYRFKYYSKPDKKDFTSLMYYYTARACMYYSRDKINSMIESVGIWKTNEG